MGRVMEVQFNRTSAGGSIFTGPITIIGMTVGLLTSGYMITKFKPPPKYLFFWNVVIGLISMCAALSYTQLGCERNNSVIVNGSIVSCNSNCACDGITYSPVCDRSTATTFYSPCHAGCRHYDEARKLYTNCSCNALSTTGSVSSLLGRLSNEITVKDTTTMPSSTTEKRITLEDVYDDDLKLNKPPHDDDVPIKNNHLYDKSSQIYEDSAEYVDSSENNAFEITENSRKIENNKRNRRGGMVQEIQPVQPENFISPGACVDHCYTAYYVFSFISMFSSLIGSTGRIGNVMLNFR